jgi:hypothetical protein
MCSRIPAALGLLTMTFAGCGRGTLKTVGDAGGDAGLSRDQAVGSDLSLAQEHEVDHADILVPDLASADLPSGPDVGSEAAPDLGRPDRATDPGMRDGAAESLPRDLLAADGPGLDAAADAPPSDVAAFEVPPFVVDGALASFCSGDAARMAVNGVQVDLAIKGVEIPYDCCDGAEFQITSRDFGLPIVFTWRQQLTKEAKLPATIDLGNPPDNWTYYLYAGCNPSSSSCSGPSDYYMSGFEGALGVALNLDNGFDMSLCLHIVEAAGSTHTRLHSLDLYAPHVQTR